MHCTIPLTPEICPGFKMHKCDCRPDVCNARCTAANKMSLGIQLLVAARAWCQCGLPDLPGTSSITVARFSDGSCGTKALTSVVQPVMFNKCYVAEAGSGDGMLPGFAIDSCDNGMLVHEQYGDHKCTQKISESKLPLNTCTCPKLDRNMYKPATPCPLKCINASYHGICRMRYALPGGCPPGSSRSTAASISLLPVATSIIAMAATIRSLV